MAVNIGDRFGHYQLTAFLGEGGMGRVYRAKDTKLRRDVALKILPEGLARDHTRIARFEREAQVLASINHPNIAAIYGVAEASADAESGSQALVLELVEGPTLAERIFQGPLSLEEVLLIGKQIAEALEAAHDAGVVHRDLKPANIKLRPDGTTKVLDFGLAKALAPDASSAATQTSTITSPAMTVAGAILGTAAYMSPEQARGNVADRRADIWAFGCVMFEMLTGRRVFEGDTVSDTLAAVLRAEPEWQRLPPALHPRLRLMLARCLEKNVKNRYQGIADARVDIQHVLANPHEALTGRDSQSPQKSSPRFLLSLAGAAVLGGLLAGIGMWMRPSAIEPTRRLTHVLPSGQSLTGRRHPMLAMAPDGSSLVYVANEQLYLRRIGEFEARPISGTESRPSVMGSISTPFFSPDGLSVGYWDALDEAIKRVDVAGGTPIVLARTPLIRGATWGDDGVILYAAPDGIWSVPGAGGEPTRLIENTQGWVHGPQMLPDRRSVLYTRLRKAGGRSWEGAEIVIHDLDGETEAVLFTGEDGRYLPTGHIVFALDTTLFAVPFDPIARRVTGGPVPVIERVRREVEVTGNTATANYAISNDGLLAYLHGPSERRPVIPRDLVMVDMKGAAHPLTTERRDYWRPRFSPDGKRVAVEVWDGRSVQIWVVDVASGEATQVTYAGVVNNFPVWTPDGKSLVVNSEMEDERVMRQWPIDGSGDGIALGVSGELFPTDFSSDGTLLYSSGEQTAARAIWTLSLADRKATEILQTPAQEHHAMFSPDGRWIAYASNASGQQEIYVRPYPIVRGTERRVSEGGASGPVWAPDGSALYYRGLTSLMVAPMRLAPGFLPGRSRALFPLAAFRFSGNASAFDIHPDGTRFVMVTMGDTPPPLPDQINIVTNWFDELRRRVPAQQ